MEHYCDNLEELRFYPKGMSTLKDGQFTKKKKLKS